MPTAAPAKIDIRCPFCPYTYVNAAAPQRAVDQALSVHIDLDHKPSELLRAGREMARRNG
jgi:hypothetical protein